MNAVIAFMLLLIVGIICMVIGWLGLKAMDVAVHAAGDWIKRKHDEWKSG